MNAISGDPLDVSALINPAPSRTGGPVMGGRKVVVIPLIVKCQVATLNSTTFKSMIIGPAPLLNVGPYLENIVPHGVGRSFSTNFQWKLQAEKSTEGDAWSAFGADILAAQTAEGMVIGSAYTTITDFGLQLRFLLAIANVSGTATESGAVSAYAALKFWT